MCRAGLTASLALFYALTSPRIASTEFRSKGVAPDLARQRLNFYIHDFNAQHCNFKGEARQNNCASRGFFCGML